MATQERVADSVAIHTDRNPAFIDTQIWHDVPHDLIDLISQDIRAASIRVARQWDQYSLEETRTGSLFGPISVPRQVGSWTTEFQFIEFSKHTKEPSTGADVAIVIDAQTADGRRGVKTIWFQAKGARNIPADWRSLPELEDQMDRMKRYTSESFGLVYTTQDAYVVGRNILSPGIPLHNFMRQAMACQYGDSQLTLLAQSLSRMDVFEILLNKSPGE